MGILKILAYLIPVRIGHRREPDRERLAGRILSNRIDDRSGWVTFGDVVENTKTEIWRFTKRIDRHAVVLRDKNDRYAGNIGRK